MAKILIAGAGGAPSEGVINSLLEDSDDEIIGMGSEPTDLILSSAHKKYIVPYAVSDNYEEKLTALIKKEKIDFFHCQNDAEIFVVSQMRDKIIDMGVKLFMPNHDVIETCVNKNKSYQKWVQAGVKVPRNIILNNEHDLKKAFKELSNKNGFIWIRFVTIGAAGKGALPTNDFEFAKRWINRFNGWGEFAAAEMLTADTVTWLSIWHKGELVVAQTRKRMGWTHGNRTLSGVTGVTKVGVTYSDPIVDTVAFDAIKAVDPMPHGIYGVDMAYDVNGFPNPTEINISRFFTTILFFTKAGLNMPKIYKDIALHNKFPSLDKKINPLPDGLMWMRGMDTKPMLVTESDMQKNIIEV